MRTATDGRGHLGIAQQPIGPDKGEHGGRIPTGEAGQLLWQCGAGLRVIARADGPLGDDHPLVDRIVSEHHGVCQEATRHTQLVSWRYAPRLTLLHTLPSLLPSPPAWEWWTLEVPPGWHAGRDARGVTRPPKANRISSLLTPMGSEADRAGSASLLRSHHLASHGLGLHAAVTPNGC